MFSLQKCFCCVFHLTTLQSPVWGHLTARGRDLPPTCLAQVWTDTLPSTFHLPNTGIGVTKGRRSSETRSQGQFDWVLQPSWGKSRQAGDQQHCPFGLFLSRTQQWLPAACEWPSSGQAGRAWAWAAKQAPAGAGRPAPAPRPQDGDGHVVGVVAVTACALCWPLGSSVYGHL